MSATEAWRCVTCDKRVATSHCPDCGEEVIDAQALGLRHILMEAFHSITDIDRRLLRTFRMLLLRPGLLTAAYIEGPRKPYLSPVQLFLIVNVLFFAIQAFAPTKVFSSSLDSHLHGQDWSSLAQNLLAQRLAAKHMTPDAYAPVFDHAVAVNARALVVVLAIPFALLLMLLFSRGVRPFATHIVFSLHFYAFQLALLCALLLLLVARSFVSAGDTLSPHVDTAMFAFMLLVSTVYLFVALGKVYGSSPWRRCAAAAALMVVAGTAVLGYRFFVFLATLYST